MKLSRRTFLAASSAIAAFPAVGHAQQVASRPKADHALKYKQVGDEPYLERVNGSPETMLVFLHSWSFNYTQIVLPGPAGGVAWLARPTWMETLLRVPNTVVVSPNFGGANNHPEGAGHPRQIGRMKLVIDTVQVEHNCKRLVVFGYSAGGYLALMLAAAYPGLVNAASVWMNIDDLAAWHREYPVMRASVEACLGGPPEGREEAYLARSPKGVLKRVKDANIWINSAESDDVIAPHHQKDSYDRLDGLPGVKRRFRSYPGRHVWAPAENDEAVRQIGILIRESA